MKKRIRKMCGYMCLLALIGIMTACGNNKILSDLGDNNSENNDMEIMREDPSVYEDLPVGGASLISLEKY